MKSCLPALAFILFAAMTGAAIAASPAPAPAERVVSQCLEKATSADQSGVDCIGVVSGPCMKAANGDDKAVHACLDNETKIWSAKMRAAIALIKKQGPAEMTHSIGDAQKAWATSLGALCPLLDQIDPGMYVGGAAACRLRETASRALTIVKLSEALGEH